MGNGFEINGTSGMLDRLALSGGQPDGQELLIVQDICTQLGITLEREMLVADREKIRLAMEREQQRGTLLRSVAHDLRSPLTAISGAGNLLADIRCSPMPSAESLPLISVRKLCG